MSEISGINDADSALIDKLSEEGNMLAEVDDFDGAIKKYEQAMAIVPQPQSEYEASMWLYASIGDMYFSKKDYETSASNLYNSLNSLNGQVSGFVHLRLGQNLFELDQRDKALNHFMTAYMLEGKDIFNGEDKKYFKFLSAKTEL
jgi:tetratricopeptide (TPR) repeat protein